MMSLEMPCHHPLCWARRFDAPSRAVQPVKGVAPVRGRDDQPETIQHLTIVRGKVLTELPGVLQVWQ